MKRYNTPHRHRVIKTRLTEEEYAEFSERVTLCKMSQGWLESPFCRLLPQIDIQYQKSFSTDIFHCCPYNVFHFLRMEQPVILVHFKPRICKFPAFSFIYFHLHSPYPARPARVICSNCPPSAPFSCGFFSSFFPFFSFPTVFFPAAFVFLDITLDLPLYALGTNFSSFS